MYRQIKYLREQDIIVDVDIAVTGGSLLVGPLNLVRICESRVHFLNVDLELYYLVAGPAR